jgi:copper chaperone CopZ
MADNSGVESGKVKRLELIGVHNCCGGCNSAIKDAIATVEGVSANTAKPKTDSIVIEGDFDGLALVQALNKAGFHVRAKDAQRKGNGDAGKKPKQDKNEK